MVDVSMNVFYQVHLILGLLLLAGLLLGFVALRFGIPRVAAYVVAGVLFSEPLLGGVLGFRIGLWAEPLTAFALGIIAYLIGGSLTIGDLRRTGKIILGTVMAESFTAGLLVALLLLFVLPAELYGVPALNLALIFGAIAVTTAPAATIAVLHQYRAQGPVTSTLLGVVALDDAFGVMTFALVIAFTAEISFSATLGAAIVQLAGAVLLGTAMGYGLNLAAKKVHQGSLRLPVVFTAILLSVGFAELWGFSSLLAAMILGFSSRYFLGASGDRLFAPIEYFEELVFLLFFTIAGAHFDPGVLTRHLGIILAYFFARLFGKIIGASVGAKLSGAAPVVVRWLGFGLAPQAGVAVGLALTLGQYPAFAPASGMIVNVILGTTLLYELLGPFLVRFALQRAGEMSIKPKRKRL